MSPKRLEGKVAIVTGGNRGIGRAVVRLFAAEGATVVIGCRDVKAGEETIAELRKEIDGDRVCVVECDVKIPEACTRLVDETLRRFHHIDIVFNNSGIVPRGTTAETSIETWNDAFATNVTGVFLMCKAVLPSMISRRRGVIVNNASDWALTAGQRAVAYCATKGAVVQLTKSIAVDHAREGIRVNAVCPGDTYVERWDALKPANVTHEEYLRGLGAHLPMGRTAHVNEIANAVLFLASDESSYMTGQTLVVDGGNTAADSSVRY